MKENEYYKYVEFINNLKTGTTVQNALRMQGMMRDLVIDCHAVSFIAGLICIVMIIRRRMNNALAGNI